MNKQDNHAYIAVRQDGLVDGACFSTGKEVDRWIEQMEGDGFKVMLTDRRQAKLLLGEQHGELAWSSRRKTNLLSEFRDLFIDRPHRIISRMGWSMVGGLGLYLLMGGSNTISFLEINCMALYVLWHGAFLVHRKWPKYPRVNDALLNRRSD